jgi:hypothetical protein
VAQAVVRAHVQLDHKPEPPRHPPSQLLKEGSLTQPCCACGAPICLHTGRYAAPTRRTVGLVISLLVNAVLICHMLITS